MISVLGGDTPSSEAVRESLERIAKTPEFREDRGLLDRLIDWIGRHLPHVQPASASSFGGGLGPFLAWLAIIALVAAIVFVIVIAVRNRSASRKRDDTSVAVELTEDEKRTAGEWRSDAERFEQRGEWIAAFRARYRELVMTLVERRLVPSSPGRTTGELVADVGVHLPGVAEQFTAVTWAFEDVWYGANPLDEDRYRSLIAPLSVVRELALHTLGDDDSAMSSVVVTVS